MKHPVIKSANILLLGLGLFAAPMVSVAESYQIEANANLTLSFVDPDFGGDVDGNTIDLEARYYLAPVETVGPWAESAFLQKSSSVGLSLDRSGGDFNDDTNFGVDLFYVTPEDYIVGGELSSSDDTDISVFGGIYLDDHTTAIARITLSDTVDSLGADYKTILQTASGNDLTVEAGAALLDAGDDTGIEINGVGTYFLSDQLGVSGLFDYEDVGDFDAFTLGTGGQYFLSETLAANAGLAFVFGDSSDATVFRVGITGRF